MAHGVGTVYSNRVAICRNCGHSVAMVGKNWAHASSSIDKSLKRQNLPKPGLVASKCQVANCMCIDATPRVAIIIQGPTGSGKTATINSIRKLLLPQNATIINLDEGWNLNEIRINPLTRYEDIESLNGETVLIEQFCANDAMENPEKWLDILKTKGYVLFVFRLKPSLETVRVRCEEEQKIDLKCNYDRYYGQLEESCSQYIRDFSSRTNLEITYLETDDLTLNDTAILIIRKSQITKASKGVN